MNTTQPQILFCQSCSMPIAKLKDFGTNVDDSQNKEYCHYCFQNGAFTEPNITMKQMIEKCAEIMRQMKMSEAHIERARTCIPKLKRWK